VGCAAGLPDRALHMASPVSRRIMQRSAKTDCGNNHVRRWGTSKELDARFAIKQHPPAISIAYRGFWAWFVTISNRIATTSLSRHIAYCHRDGLTRAPRPGCQSSTARPFASNSGSPSSLVDTAGPPLKRTVSRRVKPGERPRLAWQTCEAHLPATFTRHRRYEPQRRRGMYSRTRLEACPSTRQERQKRCPCGRSWSCQIPFCFALR
jgi:hypothetical protein